MKIAICELPLGDDTLVIERFEIAINNLQRASEFECIFYILPELWFDGAFNLDKNYLSKMSEVELIKAKFRSLSDKFDIYIHAGTYIVEHLNQVRNRAYIFTPKGKTFIYDKAKVFGFGNGEASLVKAGHENLLFEMSEFKCGVFTCYDLRFPELFRNSIIKGMQIALISASWPTKRIDHWKNLIKARAIENQIFVIACNGIGIQNHIELGGDSQVIDPIGQIVQPIINFEYLKIYDLDLNYIDTVRNDFPVLTDI